MEVSGDWLFVVFTAPTLKALQALSSALGVEQYTLPLVFVPCLLMSSFVSLALCVSFFLYIYNV